MESGRDDSVRSERFRRRRAYFSRWRRRNPVTGGDEKPATATNPAAPRVATRSPHFLPDSRHFLFYVARGALPAGVYIGELGSDKTRRIPLSVDGPARYGSGYLWFVRQGELFAQPFNAVTLELSGQETHVAADVTVTGGTTIGVSTSAAGPVAYRTGGAGRRRLVWFDRSGKQLGIVGEEDTTQSNPSLSADDRYVVVQRTVQENTDIWSLDLHRNTADRLTLGPGIDSLPVWSPDGSRIVFNSIQQGVIGLHVKHLNRGGEDELLQPRLPEWSTVIACDWSHDGRFVLVRAFDARAGAFDLWAVPTEGDRTTFAVARTQYDERDGQFSPDGKWIAYQSDDSGRPGIYLQPFPGPGTRVPVSTGSGTQVRWRRDGKDLFYIAPDNHLMVVPVSDAADARSRVGTPVPLFRTRIRATTFVARQQYVVTKDGQRFLINTVEESSVAPITLLLNWKAAASGTRR